MSFSANHSAVIEYDNGFGNFSLNYATEKCVKPSLKSAVSQTVNSHYSTKNQKLLSDRISLKEWRNPVHADTSTDTALISVKQVELLRQRQRHLLQQKLLKKQQTTNLFIKPERTGSLQKFLFNDNPAQQKRCTVVTPPIPPSVRMLFMNRLQIRFQFTNTLKRGFRMGQTLSEPITKKETSSDENHSLKIAASCMQGWRINMEDEHVHKLCLNEEKDTHFFGVYDGHGGQGAARCTAKHLDSTIVNQPAYRKGDITTACKAAFLGVDELMNKDSLNKDDSSGCTAVTVIIKGNKIYCANAGDSRAIASVRGHAQLLSFDHKPNHERELRRINAAGGFVEFNRVNGNLALSRALGDFVFKQNEHRPAEEQIVTADPDVLVKDITKDHEFIVMASDGVWDVLSNQDVVEFVRDKFAKKIEPETVCEELMERCLASECGAGGMGCDNMTVIIIAFKLNGSFDELCKKCQTAKRDPIPPSCLLSSYPDYVRGGISCL